MADKIEVFSKTRDNPVGHKWESDGTGKYTIQVLPPFSFYTPCIFKFKLTYLSSDNVKNVEKCHTVCIQIRVCATDQANLTPVK